MTLLDALETFDGVTSPASPANGWRQPYSDENAILACIDAYGLDEREAESLRRMVARKRGLLAA